LTDYQETILIIDDYITNIGVLFAYLEKKGFKVRVATSAEAALAGINHHLPDIILLDVMMPGMDGFELCQCLKANETTKDIPILFMTALTEVVDEVRGFQLGAADYITKPVQVERVLARIETHLEVRRLQRQLQLHNELLESRVQERTAELVEANQALQAEIELRKQNQREKDKLFEVLRLQSEQLRALTNWLIEAQQTERQGLAKNLHEQVDQNLDLLHINLEAMYTLIDTKMPNNLPANELMLNYLDDTMHILTQVEGHVQNVTANLRHQEILTKNPLLQLSVREREVLQLVVNGKSNNEIADLLSFSKHTVNTYRSRIKKKLNADDMPTLVKLAMRYNLSAL